LEKSDELRAFLAKATQDGVWGRLLDRGAAWSIMRQAGVLPEDAPSLGDQIEVDLAEHGFSILRAALSLRELDGTSDLCRLAFERSGNAFESLVRNGAPEAEERGFYRTIAGAAYHLAGYSAIAYSLFGEQQVSDLNANAAEAALILLILPQGICQVSATRRRQRRCSRVGFAGSRRDRFRRGNLDNSQYGGLPRAGVLRLRPSNRRGVVAGHR